MHKVKITDEQHCQLQDMRDHSSKAYLREKAAAVLKVASGTPAAVVAREGLLRKRKADTLYGWIKAFEQRGVDGLRIRPGRGRKPAFSPSVSSH